MADQSDYARCEEYLSRRLGKVIDTVLDELREISSVAHRDSTSVDAVMMREHILFGVAQIWPEGRVSPDHQLEAEARDTGPYDEELHEEDLEEETEEEHEDNFERIRT